MIRQQARQKDAKSRVRTLACVAVLSGAQTAWAQDVPSINTLGIPGLVDLPSAHSMEDADLAVTFAVTGVTLRTAISFQISPRLMGTFRYSGLGVIETRDPDEVIYDRSFDLRYQLLDEKRNNVGLVVGLQDFMGTEIYGAEYIVASKSISPGLTLTGGVGWGRIASGSSFASFGERNVGTRAEGGIPNFDRWFRGDVAAFGGVSYSPNEKLTFKLEYSPDEYVRETRRDIFEVNSPWNVGVDYSFKNGGQLSLYGMHGAEVGFQYTLVSNPRRSPFPSGTESAPLPVAPRTSVNISDLGWDLENPTYRETLESLLAPDGLSVEGFQLTRRSAAVRVRNTVYTEIPQAIGRTARAMTRVLPASVEKFTIIPTNGDVDLSAISLNRADLESLEHESATEIFERATFQDAASVEAPINDGDYPRLSWGLGPQISFSAFDPEAPIRADLALVLGAVYQPTSQLLFETEIGGRLAGNLDDIQRDDPGGLERVRTEFPRYAAETEVGVSKLAANYFGRPAPDVYSRISLGYFETMYAGLSSEVLWKPIDSPLALGVEINAVKQRAFDGGFGFRDYETVTGHLSAYYEFDNGFVGRVDAGRYLAEDWGATIALDREFPNGWRIGAFATLTDVDPEDFGEGSFDKGIRISIPTSSFTGRPSRTVRDINIRSLTRDGGARVDVPNRLYDRVRKGHAPALEKSWGRFWR